nr:hypothetical protein [Tanacetum cinerariifolium]
MKDKFQTSSIGKLTFSLGLHVKQKEDGIFISQDKYVAEILRKFGLTDGKSASTPIDTEKPLLKDPDGEDVDVHTYRSMIGSLIYLTSSIPDLMFAVCACGHFQVTPKALHLHAVKRIFRLIKSSMKLLEWTLHVTNVSSVGYITTPQTDDEAEPAKLKEVIEVVTTAKLMTKVVTVVAATTITAAPSAARRRKGDKGKGILVEELKPLKKQAQIKQDEVYARELEAELNANINWNDVIEQVKMKEKQDKTILRYQALKKKPQTEAHARRNMMLEEEASKAIKKKSESFKEKEAKKQKLDEEVEELKTHLHIVPNDEDDVYTEATPLALKAIDQSKEFGYILHSDQAG